MRWWKVGPGYVEQEPLGRAQADRDGSEGAGGRGKGSGTTAPLFDACLEDVRVLAGGVVVNVTAYRAARMLATGAAELPPDMSVHEAELVLTANDRRQAMSLRTLATEERARADRERPRFGTEE
jgi:hypothetical protein